MKWEVPVRRRTEKDKPPNLGFETAGEVEEVDNVHVPDGIKRHDAEKGRIRVVWECLNEFSILLQHQMTVSREKNIDSEISSQNFQEYTHYLVNL